MNLEAFLHIVNNPNAAKDCSTTDLEDLVKQYPFFSVAKVLLLLNLKTKGSIHFNRLLKSTAGSVPDRAHLQRFIAEDLSQVADEIAIEKILEAPTTINVIEVKDEINVVESNVEVLPIVEDAILIESIVLEAEEITQLENTAVPIAFVDADDFEDFEIETDQISSVIHSEIIENPVEIEGVEEKHSRKDWFAKFANKPLEDKKDSAKIDKKFIDLQIDRVAASAAYSFDHEFEQETTVSLKEFVEKLKVEGEAPLVINRPVGPPVSETLGRVFEKQEMFSDAIQVYQQLGLMYPDKIIYFVTLIKELKERHNIG